MSHNNIWKLNNVLMANFARGLRARDTEPKKEKLVKRGHGLGHVTYFSNFGTPLISLEQLKLHLQWKKY